MTAWFPQALFAIGWPIPGTKKAEPMTKQDISSTLAERGSRYGNFAEHAMIAIMLKQLLRYPDGDTQWGIRPGWARLAPDQQQALDTICDKIARILNGDPNYIDNWHDIQGYAKLIEDRLQSEQSGK